MKAGDVVKHAGSLWRVDYVNPCRARIVPLSKRHVVLADGREFDAERGGINISPDSPLEVVTDVARTQLEIEVEEAERELATTRAEAEQEAAKAAKPAEARAERPSAGRSGQGWQIGSAAVSGLAGTKAAVFAFVSAHPGASTKQVAAGCPEQSAGAVAACLDRFRKIGVLKKSS